MTNRVDRVVMMWVLKEKIDPIISSFLDDIWIGFDRKKGTGTATIWDVIAKVLLVRIEFNLTVETHNIQVSPEVIFVGKRLCDRTISIKGHSDPIDSLKYKPYFTFVVVLSSFWSEQPGPSDFSRLPEVAWPISHPLYHERSTTLLELGFCQSSYFCMPMLNRHIQNGLFWSRPTVSLVSNSLQSSTLDVLD